MYQAVESSRCAGIVLFEDVVNEDEQGSAIAPERLGIVHSPGNGNGQFVSLFDDESGQISTCAE